MKQNLNIRKALTLLFSVIWAILLGISLYATLVMFIWQMPKDDVHYGIGQSVYIFLISPFILFPLFFSSLYIFVKFKRENSSLRYFGLFGLFIAISGLLLSLSLLLFPDLYAAINLNPK